jgi:hypothetical protein
MRSHLQRRQRQQQEQWRPTTTRVGPDYRQAGATTAKSMAKRRTAAHLPPKKRRTQKPRKVSPIRHGGLKMRSHLQRRQRQRQSQRQSEERQPTFRQKAADAKTAKGGPYPPRRTKDAIASSATTTATANSKASEEWRPTFRQKTADAQTAKGGPYKGKFKGKAAQGEA